MRQGLVLLLAGCFVWMGMTVLFAPERAAACTCAELPDMEERLARKTAVFSGRVEKVEKPKAGYARSSGNLVRVRFTVERVWKGDLGKETVVYTAKGSSSCGYERFAVGESYLVFTHGEPNRLETGICEGTKPLSGASTELAALGEGRAPEPAARAAAPGQDGSGTAPAVGGEASGRWPAAAWFGAVGVAGVLAAIVIALILRRSRR